MDIVDIYFKGFIRGILALGQIEWKGRKTIKEEIEKDLQEIKKNDRE